LQLPTKSRFTARRQSAESIAAGNIVISVGMNIQKYVHTLAAAEKEKSRTSTPNAGDSSQSQQPASPESESEDKEGI